MSKKKRAILLTFALVPFFLFCKERRAAAQSLAIVQNSTTVAVGQTASVTIECAFCIDPAFGFGFLQLSTFDPSVATVSPSEIQIFSDIFTANVTVTGVSEGVTTLQAFLNNTNAQLVVVASISVIPGSGGGSLCSLSLEVANPEVFAGETLEYNLALQHNGRLTVSVPLRLWIESAEGEWIGPVYKEMHTLTTGDRIDLSDSVGLPEGMAPGLYFLMVDILAMNGVEEEQVPFWVKE